MYIHDFNFRYINKYSNLSSILFNSHLPNLSFHISSIRSYSKLSIFLIIYICSFNAYSIIWIYLSKISYFYIVFPGSLQYLSISSCVLSLSLFFIVFKLSYINIPIWIFYLTSSWYQIIIKVSFIRLPYWI